MKAFAIRRYGGPAVAAIEDLPAPEARSRDVTIAVKAASLNPIDYKLRLGKSKLVIKPVFPLVLGCDVAGVITAIGPTVTRFQIGDEVCARLETDRMGALAEIVCADEDVVAHRPTSVGFAQAASIPLAGLTALQALREVAELKAGQRVLIHAGAGGVGTLAIQIAKHLGAHVLTTTSTRNVEFVRGLGADEVIDYTKDDLGAIRELDAVFDTLGGASERTSLAMCKPGGVVVGVSGMPDHAFTHARLPGWARPVVWFATWSRRRTEARTGASFRFLFMRPDGANLAELAGWVDAGIVRPVLHRTYAFSDVAEAFAELERGRARGKIVVEI